MSNFWSQGWQSSKRNCREPILPKLQVPRHPPATAPSRSLNRRTWLFVLRSNRKGRRPLSSKIASHHWSPNSKSCPRFSCGPLLFRQLHIPLSRPLLARTHIIIITHRPFPLLSNLPLPSTSSPCRRRIRMRKQSHHQTRNFCSQHVRHPCSGFPCQRFPDFRIRRCPQPRSRLLRGLPSRPFTNFWPLCRFRHSPRIRPRGPTHRERPQ